SGCPTLSGGEPGSAADPWAIVGQRDFNGDGMTDILWRNGTNGQVLVWLLNGTSVIGGGSPGAPSNAWSVAGTADFNNDGLGDILWYNSGTGQVDIWLVQCNATGQNAGCSQIGGGSPGPGTARTWRTRPRPVQLNADG